LREKVDKLNYLKDRLRQEKINNKLSSDIGSVKLTTQDNNNRLYNLERGAYYGPKAMRTPIRPASKKSLLHFQFKDTVYDINDRRTALITGIILSSCLGVAIVIGSIIGTLVLIGVI